MDWKQTAARGLGWLTTLPYRAQPRVTIGPRLLGNGRLRISGPGRVVLEADVNAWSHAEVNRLVTTRQQAVIHVGQNARRERRFCRGRAMRRRDGHRRGGRACLRQCR